MIQLRQLGLTLITVVSLGWTLAANTQPAFEITTRPVTPRADPDAFERWYDQIFDADPLFIFEDRDDFEKFLAASAIDESLKGELRAKFTVGLTRDQFHAAAAWLALELLQKKGYVSIDPELWARLPHRFIERAFQHVYEKFGFTPSGSITPETDPRGIWDVNPRARLHARLRKMARTKEGYAILKHATVRVNGNYYVLLTNLTWQHLNNDGRYGMIRAATRDHDARRGLSCRVRVSDANVAAVARAFAGDRDARPIECGLRDRLSAAARTDIDVDVAELLHPFIRDRVNTYAVNGGPNCFNAGTNVHLGADYEVNFMDDFDLNTMLAIGYRRVRPGEELLAGDLMLFRRPKEGSLFLESVHVATYVTPDIVFTKNGLNKFNPYIFQDRVENVRSYFPDDKYHLGVYRPVRPGEQPIGTMYSLKYDAPYEVHHEIEYRHIKYDPLAPRDVRRKILEDLASDWLKYTQTEDLVRLEYDPRAADVRYLVRSLLATNARHAKSRSATSTVNFSALAAPAKNRQALEAVLALESLDLEQTTAVRAIYKSYAKPYADLLTEIERKFGLDFERWQKRECEPLLR